MSVPHIMSRRERSEKTNHSPDHQSEAFRSMADALEKQRGGANEYQ